MPLEAQAHNWYMLIPTHIPLAKTSLRARHKSKANEVHFISTDGGCIQGMRAGRGEEARLIVPKATVSYEDYIKRWLYLP